MISLIVAHDSNLLIGSHGRIPWNNPEDLKHFKETTMNHTVLMGRKTFESIGRPLPSRTNVVLTNNKEWNCPFPEVQIIHNLEAFLMPWKEKLETIFIIGGSEVYRQALPYANEIIVSLIPGLHQGDTFFPVYHDQFRLIAEQQKQTFLQQLYRRVNYV